MYTHTRAGGPHDHQTSSLSCRLTCHFLAMAANESISEAYIVVSNCNKTGVYYSYIFELGTHCDNACEHVWVRFSSLWFDERDVDMHHRDPRCRTFRGTRDRCTHFVADPIVPQQEQQGDRGCHCPARNLHRMLMPFFALVL